MAESNYGPEVCEEHAKFIEDLGGPKAVADHLTERLNLIRPVTGPAVSNWKVRGIPYRYRGALVVMAQDKEDVSTPKDFFGINPE